MATLLGLKNFTSEQLDTIDKLYECDELMLIAPKGFGKCPVAFTAISELVKDKVLKRILVVSTAQVCTQVWAKEAIKWSQLKDVSYVCLTDNDADSRKKLMAENTGIVICNFENLAWLFINFPKHNFDGLLIDEITKLKSVGGVGYKKLRTQLKHFKWRVGMTADPVAQESIEIYGQMLIVDQGKRLGRNKDPFKRKYFMQMDYAGHKWDPQPGGLTRLTACLADVTYTVDSKDYDESLPRLIDHEIPVKMPEKVRDYYNALIKHNFVYIGHQALEAPNEAVLQGKLLQLCCGSVYRTPEDDAYGLVPTSKKEAIFLHDAKMVALDKLVKTISTPVLVNFQFSFQRDALMKKYNAPIFSAKNSKKTNDNLIDLWNKGSLPMLLVHAKSVGHGLNFQYGTCHTLICLGYLWSADEWNQLLGRLRRRGQKSSIVSRYTIFCVDTIEDCVMKGRISNREESSEIFHAYLKGHKL